MDAIMIIILVSVGFLLFLIIMNGRQKKSDEGRYHGPDENLHQHHYAGFAGHGESDRHDQGDLGSRDISHNHHKHGDDDIFDSGGDWGGDAGGADSSGGDGAGGE